VWQKGVGEIERSGEKGRKTGFKVGYGVRGISQNAPTIGTSRAAVLRVDLGGGGRVLRAREGT